MGLYSINGIKSQEKGALGLGLHAAGLDVLHHFAGGFDGAEGGDTDGIVVANQVAVVDLIEVEAGSVASEDAGRRAIFDLLGVDTVEVFVEGDSELAKTRGDQDSVIVCKHKEHHLFFTSVWA